tara:strand:- start:849 stop:1424 length:576 start_codon:yes stop_codon:yes gene_type:complete
MTLNQKLSTIQTKFKSKKSRFNSFGKYNFRSAEDILEAIKPYLLELGVSVRIKEKLISTDPMPILESTAVIQDEKGMEIKATALVGVDLNQKGMQTPQKFGSASSYGKKYALGNLLLIDDTQDSDASNDHGKTTIAKPKPVANKAEIKSNQDGKFQKALDYIRAGGKMAVIEAKYNLTPNIKKELIELTTL